MHDEINDEVKPYRQADHGIDPIFLNRWSPRAFSSEPIDDETLLRAFEAARWAPSSFNEQPWRFVIARTIADRQRFVEFLFPANQAWAKYAPVLIVVVAKKTFSHNGSPNSVAVFDAGTAWGYLSLGASQAGLITHGMAGFDRDKARETLRIPDDYEVAAVIAMGKRGDKAQLPPEVQARELPSGRRPVTESIMEGGFKASP